MKSKLTNFLLAGAFIFAASSTFVSCKDYESDDIQQVKYDVSNLDANMQNEVNALNKRIDSLKNALMPSSLLLATLSTVPTCSLRCRAVSTLWPTCQRIISLLMT